MDLEGVLIEDQRRDTLLYAGRFSVRITDWFFFKDRAELKYIGLENATIQINRTDSVWNYAFIQDYFATPNDTAKKKAGIEFDLKQVEMKNVRFVKRDRWLGEDMTVAVRGLNLDADQLTLSGRTLDINSLVLDHPEFFTQAYTGRATTRAPKVASTAAADDPWNISFGSVRIINGRYRNDRNRNTPLPTFDGQHIDFYNINATIANLGFTQDTLRGRIDLTAKERSGLVVKSLKAQTTIHPQAMIFDKLTLVTNTSTLGNYFAMRYNNISDMSNFIRAVKMEAHFNNARITSSDLAFFAPALKTWNKEIRINGAAHGTVDGLSSEDIEIGAGRDTYIRGAVSLVGLPNINETLINIDAKNLRTTYRDAITLVPALRRVRTPDLQALSYLQFKGSFTGLINDFVTYGTIQTALGVLQTDLNMKLPANGRPVYLGTIATGGFNLGRFLNNADLGTIALRGTVRGSGFDPKTLDANIDGTVARIDLGSYSYRNITVKGNLRNLVFDGDIKINDPAARLALNGLVDLSGSNPRIIARADVDYADLRTLQLIKDDLKLSGGFDVNMSGSSLENLVGRASIRDAKINANGRELSFDSLNLYSSFEDGQRLITVASNVFSASVKGDYDPAEIPAAFNNVLRRYYPSYFRATTPLKRNQVFNFELTTNLVEDYLFLIDPNLSGFNGSVIKGSIDTRSNSLQLQADIPSAQYRQYAFEGFNLTANGDGDSLALRGVMENARISDSVLFPNTEINVIARGDLSDITINTSSNQAINQAQISAQVETAVNGAKLKLNPSSFVLNGKTWRIQEGGELDFRKGAAVQGNVVLTESNQSITLSTEPDDVFDFNNLIVEWKNLNLGDITPLFVQSNRIEGSASGRAVIADPTGRMNINGNFEAQELRLDNDSIGGFRGSFAYNNRTGAFTVKGANTNPDHGITVDVALNLKDTANAFQDRISARLTNFELKYLNRFLGTLFSDIQGTVTGNLDIVGEGSGRNYLAKAKLSNASFKVNFTQVTYKLFDTEFEMTNDRINLSGIRLRDRFGQTAKVTGYIGHRGFKDMYYDIKVETESDRMELLNTSINDNQQFYGRARGGGTFVLVGPQSDMLMDINIRASDQDSSFITLPPSESRESGQATFMVERQYGREMVSNASAAASNLRFDVRLTSNPKVQVEVILDQLTGDAIRGSGSTTNLHITSGTSEPLQIQGRYEITQGSYDFTFQSFLNKNFKLRPGSNSYITWDGDPFDATVRLDATYEADNVNLAPLANSGLFAGDARDRVSNVRSDVYVDATLTGNLFQPVFDFKLRFPNNNLTSNPDFQLALQQIEKNPNELNKQVTYLIVFNSFAPFESVDTRYAINEFTYNTISGLLFNKVNEQLNRVLSKILQNNNATFNISGSLYNRNPLDAPAGDNRFQLPNQSLVNFGLGLPLLNGRAQFTIGATVDVPLQNEIQQQINLFPDVTLELLINKSGSVRATFFFRRNIDFVTPTTQNNISARYGASIGVAREVDRFSDFFRRKKKTPPKPAQDSIPPAQTILPKKDSTSGGGNPG